MIINSLVICYKTAAKFYLLDASWNRGFYREKIIYFRMCSGEKPVLLSIVYDLAKGLPSYKVGVDF